MAEEIIITGKFDVKGINTENFSKPLTYLKLSINYPMIGFKVEQMSSELTQKEKVR